MAAAVLFFIIMTAAAYIVYKMLAKTVKYTIRLVIAAVMFAMATGGGAALWLLGGSEAPRSPERPPKKASSPR